MAPLAFSGPPEAALQRLASLLGTLPRTRVVSVGSGALHAEVRTRWLRFTDDLHFLLDARAGVFHVRSASRVGWSDIGTNRRRVEALRAAWDAR